jgi:hypothetical protein
MTLAERCLATQQDITNSWDRISHILFTLEEDGKPLVESIRELLPKLREAKRQGTVKATSVLGWLWENLVDDGYIPYSFDRSSFYTWYRLNWNHCKLPPYRKLLNKKLGESLEVPTPRY